MIVILGLLANKRINNFVVEVHETCNLMISFNVCKYAVILASKCCSMLLYIH